MAFESFDLWTHPFCLCCDKQTEGAAYCSEACRLADFEKPANTSTTATTTSTTAAAASAMMYSASPSSELGSSWTSRQGAGKFYLSPAFDFSSAHSSTASSPTSRSSSLYSAACALAAPSSPSWSQQRSLRSLSPSSSHTSLSSIDTAAAAAAPKRDSLLISEKSRRELQDYAKHFEHARSNRRRSH